MNHTFPQTITNGLGEQLTFLDVVPEPDGDRVLVENRVKPGVGPLMHTHFLQDEYLTVVAGRIGYQVKGEAPKYAGVGESVTFLRGVPHRFWNAGEEELYCKGWIKPANTIVFYLSSIFRAQIKSGSERPDPFDGAYLITRYRNEYDLPDLPWAVKKLVMPATYYLGKLLGKYRHFRNAPEPLGTK